jgi:hypothetical protein
LFVKHLFETKEPTKTRLHAAVALEEKLASSGMRNSDASGRIWNHPTSAQRLSL